MEEEIFLKRKGNNKKKLITLFLSIGLVLLVTGVSYSFFMYYKTGLYTYTITGGKMNVIYDEVTGNNIVIENAYPRTDEEALTYGLEFEFSVTGYNESEKNVYYAIEMDHGDDVASKNRFLDTDMKLTLYENEELIFENERFENLDNQDIYYSYIKYGTSKEAPVTNNYKLRIWISDNVFITNTPDAFDTDGKSVYSTSEFENSYANFKVNIKADLTYKDTGYLTYDANGGSFTPSKTSLLTNRITMQKPVMTDKAFLGWSSNPDASEAEYKSGEYYTKDGQMLYAVYSDTRNVMGKFLSPITDYKEYITEVYFVNASKEEYTDYYNTAPIKADLTLNNQGEVLGWLVPGDMIPFYDNDIELEVQSYILYVVSEGTTYLTDCASMFVDWFSLKKIDFSNVDTSMVTDMSYMFSMDASSYLTGISNDVNRQTKNTLEYKVDEESNNINQMYCVYETVPYNQLTTLDLTAFNTRNVNTMEGMFYVLNDISLGSCGIVGDTYLTFVDFSTFDTSNVKNMSYMFNGNNMLSNLDLTYFNTSKVEDMSYMFNAWGTYWDVTYSLDVSTFNTNSVTDMSYMFADSSYLKVLDISGFDTSNVINMSSMFNSCSITNLDVSNFNTSNVTDMSFMFESCSNLITLDVSGFDTAKVENMNCMFRWCGSLINLDVSNFNTSNVMYTSYMFTGCSQLNDLDVSGFDTSKVINMMSMFSNCYNISNLKVNGFDTSNVENMSYMFNSCNSLTELDLSNWDFSNVTDCTSIFDCYRVTEIYLKNAKISNVLANTFSSNGSLEYIDMSGAILIGDMTSLFKKCEQLLGINLSGVDTSQVTNMSNMFYGCILLEYLNVSDFDTSNVTNMSNMFNSCYMIEQIDVSNFDTNKVTNMSGMFAACGVSELDLSSFNVSNVTDMSGMFTRCANLRILDINTWDISNVTTISARITIYCSSEGNCDSSDGTRGIFSYCPNLEIIYCNSDWNNGKISATVTMFENCAELQGAITFDASKKTVVYANPTTGYFTSKS